MAFAVAKSYSASENFVLFFYSLLLLMVNLIFHNQSIIYCWLLLVNSHQSDSQVSQRFSQPLWASRPAGVALDGNLDLVGTHRKRHALGLSHLQTFLDCLANITLCFRLGFTLTDTAGDRWTFRNKHAIFVLE